MPIYEYLCEKCDHEFEREQRISDPPAKACPRCRSRKVKRLISQTSFVLKGGGWYSDLYSSAGKDKKEPAGDSKSESKSDSKKDSKGESKSDSKGGGSSKKGPSAQKSAA